jgi:hypothetical protein
MRSRWALVVAVALVVTLRAAAQPIPPPAPTQLPPIPAAPAPPVAPLPPLLPVPAVPQPPLAEVPRPGPAIEYDHGYQYLPERLPERRGADVCGPDGRWWFAPSLELSWVPARFAPSTVRLAVLSLAVPGGALPGPLLPVGGRSSGRFDAALNLMGGHWFGETNTHGVDASLFLRDARNTFTGASPGSLVLFPRGRGRGAQVVAFADPAALAVIGAFPATLGTFFASFDVNYRHKLFCTDDARLDFLIGYRHAYLEDELYLGDRATDRTEDGDDYRLHRAGVTNSFHGGQIGLAGEVRANGWYVSGAVKVAFGGVTSEIEATGAFVGAEARTFAGFRRLGALGPFEQTEFAVVPALNVQVGRQIGAHARVFAGYSFTYLSRAARLGDVLNPAFASPVFTTFWAQSVGFGAEFRF